MGIKNKKLNLGKDLLFNLYYTQNKSTVEIGEELGCSCACVRKYMKLYNLKRRTNSESVKLQRTHWTREKEETRSKKFIITWNNKTEEEKRGCTRNAHKNANSPEAIMKARQTKYKNGSYQKSKAENDFYSKLKLFVDVGDIIRGYTEERYPYNCDFYIKSFDLFIEYQGHWSHGTEPYNSENSTHNECIKSAQERKLDLSTWFIRDVKKLEKAKQSKIKLLLIYPKHDSYLVKEGVLINIGKFDITKINDLCK